MKETYIYTSAIPMAIRLVQGGNLPLEDPTYGVR